MSKRTEGLKTPKQFHAFNHEGVLKLYELLEHNDNQLTRGVALMASNLLGSLVSQKVQAGEVLHVNDIEGIFDHLRNEFITGFEMANRGKVKDLDELLRSAEHFLTALEGGMKREYTRILMGRDDKGKRRE